MIGTRRLLLLLAFTIVVPLAFVTGFGTSGETARDETAPAPPPSPPSGSTAGSAKVRGMTISCPTDGREWGTDDMVTTMRDLKALGVNWISIHPYAHVHPDGRLRPYYGRGPDEQVPQYVTRPIREAHRLGMKLMMKPHISYWGSFSWRGAVKFEKPEEWQRFFAGYEKWILDLAAACPDVDAFVVGTELEATTAEHEKEWRRVIRGVRARYSGPLTYAANWSDYRKVPFWDAVDVVGLQAYFPLLPQDGAEPTLAQLREGWQGVLEEVRELSRRTGKNIVFTELGYNRSVRAPYTPWDHEVGGGEHAEEIQTRCLTAALEAIEGEPRVHGSFLWKWFPGNVRARNFDQSAPAVRAVISRIWGPDSD